jgi:hypothetical protein
VIPQRWVVERTIGWMSKHYDVDSATGEEKILLASIYYLSKRLTYQEADENIDLALDVKLRKLAEKNAKTITQLP